MNQPFEVTSAYGFEIQEERGVSRFPFFGWLSLRRNFVLLHVFLKFLLDFWRIRGSFFGSILCVFGQLNIFHFVCEITVVLFLRTTKCNEYFAEV